MVNRPRESLTESRQSFTIDRGSSVSILLAALLFDHSVNDESQLISSALNGDSSSFGVLVTRYQNRLLSCVLGVINDVEEAEDVVQESFVQAYVKLDTFQQNSRFFTWLYRIAFNNALSRRRRRRGALSLDQAANPVPPIRSPTSSRPITVSSKARMSAESAKP